MQAYHSLVNPRNPMFLLDAHFILSKCRVSAGSYLPGDTAKLSTFTASGSLQVTALARLTALARFMALARLMALAQLTALTANVARVQHLPEPILQRASSSITSNLKHYDIQAKLMSNNNNTRNIYCQK